MAGPVMVSLVLVLSGAAVLALSGLAGFLFRNRQVGQRVSTAVLVLGAVVGLVGLLLGLGEGSSPRFDASWFLPWGRFSVALDPLSAVFLVPALVVPALGSWFGLGYWPAHEHPENTRRLGLAYGLLAGAMVLVLVARDGLLFLMAWEVMALAAFFAATAEHNKPEVAEAGWIYLVATHVGTLVLLGMFALWAQSTGSFALDAPRALAASTATALFVLALVGFGFKAGLVPVHVWLPGAHAQAPSHVSAVMSGVMLKMGVYGVVRMTGLVPPASEAWGLTLLVVGGITGVGGLLWALGQTDLKRVLAYSSIENIGVITMALGLAELGRFSGRAEWVVLGLAAALFHTLSHGLFKPLMFLGAGAVIHRTGTRHLDRMGGLGQRAPWLMALVLVGAVALAGLPPLNGFVGEWLLFLGFFHSLTGPGTAGLLGVASGAVVLALIGALGLAVFVRLFGAVFLGQPRTTYGPVHDVRGTELVPLVVLAAGCLALGVVPGLVLPWIDRAVQAWSQGTSLASIEALSPTGGLTALAVGLLGLVLLILGTWARVPRNRPTWDCGYADPTPRMEYTGTSVGQGLVGLFAVVLRPRTQKPVPGAFHRKAARFRQSVPDFVLERLVLPVFRGIGRQVPRFRFLQQGQTQVYILYVFVAMLVLLGVAEWGGGHG